MYKVAWWFVDNISAVPYQHQCTVIKSNVVGFLASCLLPACFLLRVSSVGRRFFPNVFLLPSFTFVSLLQFQMLGIELNRLNQKDLAKTMLQA
jgi:hypothetical protein